MKDLIRAFGTAMDVLGVMLGGVLAGYLAWRYFHAPWWVLSILSISGLAGGMIRVYKLNQKWDNQDPPPPSP